MIDTLCNLIKYNLTKLKTPTKCWYEIPIDRVKQLFEDERFTGEIVHLYSDNEDGIESLMDHPEKLGYAIFEALEDRTLFALHSFNVCAQQELFEIRGIAQNPRLDAPQPSINTVKRQ